MKTIAEVQAAVDDLSVMMSEKGIRDPNPSIEIYAHRHPYVWLRAYGRQFDGKSYQVFDGKTVGQAVSKARAYIKKMMDPQEAITREYLTRVASAVDYATENAIADEYVAPLRGVTCAMTDNLLTSQEADQ